MANTPNNMVIKMDDPWRADVEGMTGATAAAAKSEEADKDVVMKSVAGSSNHSEDPKAAGATEGRCTKHWSDGGAKFEGSVIERVGSSGSSTTSSSTPSSGA